MNVIRAHNYKVDVNLGDRSYQKLLRAFPGIENLPSLQRLRSRMTFLSGVRPIDYHCCINSCCCFTGPFMAQTTCPYCGQPRYTPSGKPRKLFQYVPLTPRLLALYGNADVAKTLRYRHEYQSQPRTSADVFDGSHYKQLCRTPVTIDGEKLGHKFFSQPTDIAIGLSTDGFGLFKHRKQTCWPIIVFLYNFPPEIRVQLANIYSLGLIPGPTAPKDFDSFLVPVVEELLKLAQGIPALDAHTNRNFMLHTYLILAFGDMPALAKMLRLKGTNAIVPCRACRLTAIRDPNGGRHAHYYAALHSPSGPSFQPLDLPLRTHDEFMRQALDVARSEGTAQSNLATLYGINGVPILATLSSISIPASFPHDFMHIMENIIPMLINHWTGTFKGLDVGSESYEIPKTVWESIGEACAASGTTIPTAFGAQVPNIATHRYLFIAETWMLLLVPSFCINTLLTPSTTNTMSPLSSSSTSV
jgi:Transposase family tnp2